MIGLTRHFKQQTVTVQDIAFSPNLPTALDAAVVAAMDLILATPPTGFQQNSISLDPPILIFDGTNYIYSQTFNWAVNV